MSVSAAVFFGTCHDLLLECSQVILSLYIYFSFLSYCEASAAQLMRIYYKVIN